MPLSTRNTAGYMYYTFIDDGILEMSRFWERDWSSFETSLNEDQPTVGFSLGSTLFHHENVDANLTHFIVRPWECFSLVTRLWMIKVFTSVNIIKIYLSVHCMRSQRDFGTLGGEVYTSRK